MNEGILQKTIEEYVSILLQDDSDVFPVDIKVNPGNSIFIYLDADSGVTIEKCTRLNRALYKQIEENGLFPAGDFSLEVSSPGINEPLKLKRQYKKNIGRTVEVTLNDGSKKAGKLTEVNDEQMIIEETDGKGKKAIIKKTTILFNEVKHTKVLVTF